MWRMKRRFKKPMGVFLSRSACDDGERQGTGLLPESWQTTEEGYECEERYRDGYYYKGARERHCLLL